MRTVALVESPAQLLNVVEWAHHSVIDPHEIAVTILAPTNELSRLQLRAMATLAKGTGLSVNWHEPRQGGAAAARTVRSLGADLAGVQRLVVGDPFSGVIQVVLSISGAAEVVVVDDGTATMEFARQWVSGEHLTRWHQGGMEGHRDQIARIARNQVSTAVRRRIGPGSGCQLRIFSCLPVDVGPMPVTRNSYRWTRQRYQAPRVKAAADLVGTSLVETGVVEPDAYLRAVATLAAEHGVDRYFAHRRESAAKLSGIAALGLEVVRPDLPLEIAARAEVIGREVISFPSTPIHTLPLVLADTASRVLVCDIERQWLTPRAAPASARFLSAVSDTARGRYGLAAVAC